MTATTHAFSRNSYGPRTAKPVSASQADRRVPKIQVAWCALFLVAWLHNAWSLHDFGAHSLTLMMLASAAALAFARFEKALLFILPIISGVIALVIGISSSTSDRSVTNFGQQLVACALAIGVASLNWPRVYGSFKLILFACAVPVILYGGYQLKARSSNLPFAYLPVTNIQQYADGEVQRGANDRFHVPRASSVFVEPSDFGYFSCWLFVVGLSSRKAKTQLAFLGGGACGLALSSSLGGVIGVVLMATVLAVRSGEVRRLVMVAGLLSLGIAAALIEFQETSSKFSLRILAAVSLDPSADSGRVSNFGSDLDTSADALALGHGLAVLPQLKSAIGYSTLLIERGAVGALLYMFPYLIAVAFGWMKFNKEDELSRARLLFAVLNLYNLANFSMLYFGPFAFALGFALSSNQRREGGLSAVTSPRRAWRWKESRMNLSLKCRPLTVPGATP